MLIFDTGNSHLKAYSTGDTALMRYRVARVDATRLSVAQAVAADTTETVLIETEAGLFAVGEFAHYLGEDITQTGYARYGSLPWKLAIQALLYSLYQPGSHQLPPAIFQIPPSAFQSGTDAEVRTLLSRSVFRFRAGRIGGELNDYEFEFAESVRIMPEGVGALAYVALNDKGAMVTLGEDLARAECVVIDVGGFTTDLISLAPNFIAKPDSHSITAGAGDALDNLNARVTARYRRPDIDARTLERILRSRTVVNNGAVENVSEDVEAAMLPVVERIAQAWRATRSVLDATHVIVAGGGGNLMFDHLRTAIQHPQMINAFYAHGEAPTINPTFLNVEGLARFMRLVERSKRATK